MKALVKKEAAPGLWLEDAPEPVTSINDVLIRIEKTSICGTDVHIYNWDAWARKTIPVPMTIGHEFCGIIVEIGSNVHDFAVGDVVSGEGHLVCGRCRNCLAGRRHLCAHTRGIGVNTTGCFAEYLALPMTNVWHADPKIPREIISCFDPLGNATHTALAFEVLGEDVLITGAGPIGCMAAAICRHAGARHVVVTDLNPWRLELAKTLGATRVVDVSREDLRDVQKELGMTEGFDVSLEMSGSPRALEAILDNACHGGRIALLGIFPESFAIDWDKVIFNGLSLRGIYGREMYETWYQMTAMLQSGLEIAPVITHRFHWTEFEEGFAAMKSGRSGKVILDWTEFMSQRFLDHVASELEAIRAAGLWKAERLIDSAQAARIELADGREVINMCSNNYLGLANHPEVAAAARAGIETWGYGLASVRFICGTQSLHRELEMELSTFLGTEETILYSSCFDANAGLFETLLGAEDAVISDALNHASIIDGIRLCKAKRFRYANRDLADLKTKLVEATTAGARFKMIATDGVFSMDGTVAPLREICDLAHRHDALVMVDDSHAVGVLGQRGRGTPEHAGVAGRIDLTTGTLGKALGGASGGYASGRKLIIDLLRQRSRPYLFSNTLAPAIAAGTRKVLEMLSASTAWRDRLWENTAFYVEAMRTAGFDLPGPEHPIVPIMIGDAVAAQQMAAGLLDRGVHAISFSYPVVPQGAARIRTQISAAHTKEDLEKAVAAFAKCRAN